jgi:DNA primase
VHEGHDALAHGAIPVLVEGPLDAIAVTVATGGTHVGVATLGTAFTDAQADQLTDYIGTGRPGVTVATDADRAGQQAAARAYWQLTARGDNPRHVLMPDGTDPAQLLETCGQQAVRDALAESQPLATRLIDARLAEHADTHSAAAADVLATTIRGAADIIGALPPEHWLGHIDHVTHALQISPGPVHLAVIDTGHAWTEDPRRLARTRMNEDARQPTHQPASAGAATTAWVHLGKRIDPGLTQQPEGEPHSAAITRAQTAGHNVETRLARLSAEAPHVPQHPARERHPRLVTEVPEAASTPTVTATAESAAATNTAQDLHHGKSTPRGAGNGCSTEPEPQRPDQRWRRVADSIDPQLAASPGWGGLAATIDHAAQAGFDVETHLPRLAAETPLPDNAPAIELQYRLLAEVDIEPAHDTGPAAAPSRSPRHEPPPSASRPIGRDGPSGPRR